MCPPSSRPASRSSPCRRAPIRATRSSAATAPGWRRCRAGSRVGTSSLRRVCQVRAARADLSIEILRGNVDTRLRKVAEGVVDAAVLASAGLDRLGFSARIAERLDTTRMLPAIGQGALALESRADDDARREVVPRARRRGRRGDDDRRARAARGPGRRLSHARRRSRDAGRGRLTLTGLVGRPDASEMIREAVTGAPADAAAMGAELARRLLARGADRILRELEI